MSISSTTNRMQYTGNGSVSVYSYSFKVFSDAHLKVTVRSTSGVETTLALATDYTVSGVGSPNGGSITLVNSSQSWLTSGKLKSGYTLTIRRVIPLKQETDIRNQGSFYPEEHENVFDRLTMVDQQQQDAIDRSVKFSETVPGSAFDVTLPVGLIGSAYTTIITNASGTGLAVGPTKAQIEDAATYASNAANSATSASTSATASANSATASATSATAAATSATNAATSASNAATSATAASGSATAAATSATAAATSATAAAGSASLAASLVANPVLDDGTAADPSLHFSADTDVGLYRPGTNTLGFSAGGYKGLEVKKSTGNYANVGMGTDGSASTSDSLPLAIQRSISGQLAAKITNASSNAAAAAKVELSVDSADKNGEVAVYPSTSTVTANAGRMAVRPKDGATGLSLSGGDLTSGDVRVYTAGDHTSTGEALRVNADKTVQLPQSVSAPDTPSAGMKLYNDGGVFKTKNSSGTVRQYATLDGTESLSNKSIDASSNTLSNISNSSIASNAAIAYTKLNLSGALSNSDLATNAAIARSKIASGSSNHVVINDGSGNLSSVAVIPVANGGTNSSTALNNNRVMTSSGSKIVEADAITAARALISDANGLPTHSSVTSTELGYVSGVTSAIQTQIDTKAPKASPTFTGTVTTPLTTAGPVLTSSGGVISSEAQLATSRGGTGVNSTATFPTSGTVVTDTNTVTLSNKTISAASNTISGLTDSNLSASAAITRSKLASGTASHVIINDGSGVLSSEATLAKSRGGAGADMSSVTFPTSGTLVTTTGTQTLTAKDIDGGTASNTSRITLPKDTKANLDLLTRKAGTVVYGSDTSKAYIDTGSELVQIGSGSGGGATGGGSDAVFFENNQTVNYDYTITTDKNAMSAGPITIASGKTVTVPSGSVWTIV